MKAGALVVSLLAIVVSLARADVGVYCNPSASAVAGVYKTLRKAKHVRRQITPGGNLVRAVFRGGACTLAVDPYADSWVCTAAIAGTFRAQGQTAASETQVVYKWNAEQRRLVVSSDALVVAFGSDNNFAAGVEVQSGNQAFVAAASVEEVVPGSRCRAFLAVSATSDVNPVRVFDVPMRRAASSRISCGFSAPPTLTLQRAGLAALYPSATRTPGAKNPAVTQANIYQTICRPHWTATIRPPAAYTNALKRQQMQEYGDTVSDPDAQCMVHSDNTKCYEEDHFIALELGGDPQNPRNLWPEPYAALGAQQKDWVETFLKRRVCNGTMTLRAAQQAITADWVAVYQAAHPAGL